MMGKISVRYDVGGVGARIVLRRQEGNGRCRGFGDVVFTGWGRKILVVRGE